MEYKHIILTPEIAREWLETMPEYQRKPSDLVVAEYANDMADGRWVENTGDAFRFNAQGQMIDGQHRCLAVVKSGVPIMATVIDGLGDEVYLVLDKGRKRSAADTIGGKNAAVRAAIAKSFIALENGIPLQSVLGGNTSKNRSPVSATKAAIVAMRNDELISKIAVAHSKLRCINRGNVPTSVTVCLAAYAAEMTGTVDTFIDFCCEMAKPVDERPTVCTMAREKAMSYGVKRGKSRTAHLFAIFAIAFKHWIAGTTPKIIQTGNITNNTNAVPVRRDWGLDYGTLG